ncbi:uncharacterized protein N7503_004773 [Penicillium pulvis]|uniref:uncharacterized protein n=1 Tax=Penicillium pulvis TaxID=1562058 RepID=UPI0025467618|nr:uncharacterized protein N7503_004773 [Penicillium pulvis]KAJ5802323.1 hypothetical protein N7503_004773 [Penicillium pulvis]
MDWSWSSSFICPSDTPGIHGWETAQLNDPGSARPSREVLPFYPSTELQYGNIDGPLDFWPKLDSALVEYDGTECMAGAGTAHASLSLFGPEHQPIIPRDADSGLALSHLPKPAGEPVGLPPKTRHIGEGLEITSCKQGQNVPIFVQVGAREALESTYSSQCFQV